jgi:hypothetical protein
MAPFEALYGRRCRTPLNWSQPGERGVFGPDIVTEAERKVKLIRKNLEATQGKGKPLEISWSFATPIYTFVEMG